MSISRRLLKGRAMHHLTSCLPCLGYQLPISRLLIRQFQVDTKILELAVEVFELAFEERGRTFTYTIIHLKTGLRPDDKHSVKNYLLGNEAARFSSAALELLIEARIGRYRQLRMHRHFRPRRLNGSDGARRCVLIS